MKVPTVAKVKRIISYPGQRQRSVVWLGKMDLRVCVEVIWVKGEIKTSLMVKGYRQEILMIKFWSYVGF